MLGVVIFCLLILAVLAQLGFALYIAITANYEYREFTRWNSRISKEYLDLEISA